MINRIQNKFLILILICLPLSLVSKMIVLPLSKEIPAVLDFAISANEKWVLSGFENKTAILWNLYNNKFLVFPRNSASLNALAISPTGKQIAFQSDENIIKIYSIEGTVLFSLVGHKETIRSIEFSPKGNFLLTGSEDASLKLWDTSNGKLLKTIKSHIDTITSVGFSNDNRFFFSASEDGKLKIWSLEGKLIKEFSDHFGPIMDAKFSFDSKKILTAGDDGKIILYDLDSENKKTIQAHSNSVRSVEFSDDGKKILSSSEDRSIKVWSSKGELLSTSNVHEANITQARFLKSGMILTSSDDGSQKLLSQKGKILATIVITEYGKIIYTDKGNFDFDNEKLENLLFFNPDETELEIETKVFFPIFHTPNLLSQVLSGIEKDNLSIEKIYSTSPPPDLKLKTLNIENEKINLEVKICDNGGGFQNINFYQNKILITPEKSKSIILNSIDKCSIRKLKLDLNFGENEFQVTSTSKLGLVGYSNIVFENFKKENFTKSKLIIKD